MKQIAMHCIDTTRIYERGLFRAATSAVCLLAAARLAVFVGVQRKATPASLDR